MNFRQLGQSIASRIIGNQTGQAQGQAHGAKAEDFQKVTIAPPQPRPMYRNGRYFQAELDEFEKRFATSEYFHRITMQAGKLRIGDKPFPSKQCLALLLADLGTLPPEQLTRIAEIHQRKLELNKELEAKSWANITRDYIAQATQHTEKLLAGEKPEQTVSHKGMESHFVEVRKALHAAIRKLNEELYSILNPYCAQMKEAAERQAMAMDDEERKAAEKFGVAFAPSMQLRVLVAFALEIAMAPVADFENIPFMNCPENPADLWNSFVREPLAAAPTQSAAGIRRPELYMQNDARLPFEAMREKNDAKAEADAAAIARKHADEVAQLNELNDRIRNGQLHKGEPEQPK